MTLTLVLKKEFYPKEYICEQEQSLTDYAPRTGLFFQEVEGCWKMVGHIREGWVETGYLSLVPTAKPILPWTSFQEMLHPE